VTVCRREFSTAKKGKESAMIALVIDMMDPAVGLGFDVKKLKARSVGEVLLRSCSHPIKAYCDDAGKSKMEATMAALEELCQQTEDMLGLVVCPYEKESVVLR